MRNESLTGVPNFTNKSPLGVCVDDIPAMNELGNVEWARMGYLDVTAAPFGADPTGKTDSTKAIQDAVIFARYHKLATFFPKGEYLVSDTITCLGGWSDYRDVRNPYMPYVEQWPCVLVGDASGGARPKIILRANSEGYDDPAHLKAVVCFNSAEWNRTRQETGKALPLGGSPGFLQTFKGLDVVVQSGNPGAVAVFMDAAEGSTIQDCALDAGDGFAGLHGSPGSGGAIFNVTVRGGEIGMFMTVPRPVCTVVGARFSGQRRAAIHYEQRGALTIVGCEFDLSPGVTAIASRDTLSGAVSVVDSLIRYESPSANNLAFQIGTSFYARNVYLRNAAMIGARFPAPESEWVRIDELAVPHKYERFTNPVYVNGALVTSISRIEKSAAPREDFVRKHILWDEETFPAFNKAGCANVKEAPYNAKGDGEADDHAALQQAIDENEAVFLPKGAYAISRTLKLKPNTKIIGVSPAYSLIAPMEAPGGDFTDPANPRPALLTADAGKAKTELGFFGVYLPPEKVHAVYMIDWRCGGRSFMRNVNLFSTYCELDWTVFNKRIYPWTNWTWADMGDLAMIELPDGVTHSSMSGFAPDTTDGNRRNWAMQQVHGNGGGGWYPQYSISTRYHGKRHRHVLVENVKGPFSIYHIMLQFSRGDAEMEIVNSENVSVYGVKKELNAPLLIRNSKNVLFTGTGGPGLRMVEGWGLFRVVDSKNVRLANIVSDPPREPSGAALTPLVYVSENGKEVFSTRPMEYPALVFWGEIGDNCRMEYRIAPGTPIS